MTTFSSEWWDAFYAENPGDAGLVNVPAPAETPELNSVGAWKTYQGPEKVVTPLEAKDAAVKKEIDKFLVNYVESFQCPHCNHEWGDEDAAEECCYPCPECHCLYDDEQDAFNCCAYNCSECGDTFTSEYDADACCQQEDCCYRCGEVFSCCADCGCDNCSSTGDRYTGEREDYVHEGDVAKSLGLDKSIVMSQECADYYLLQSMKPTSNVRVYSKLRSRSNHLGPMIATYLDMAIGGELRHALVPIKVRESHDCPVIRRDRKRSRGLAWSDWLTWKTRADRCALAVSMFGYDGGASWKGGYGGDAWRKVAATLALRAEMGNDIAWLDRVWNLVHNGGPVLDKLWDCSDLRYQVLPAHGTDNYPILLKHASPGVVGMFRALESRSEV